MDCQFLDRGEKPSLAYVKIDRKGHDAPTLVFLGGYKSDMTGSKALFLEKQCVDVGLGYLRFDYTAHGQSGGVFKDCTIGEWYRDALDVIQATCDGPVILIGSSLGGWISLLLTTRSDLDVAGLILLAPAPDFTREIPEKMTAAQHAEMAEKGYIEVGHDYGDDPYIFTQKLLDEGADHYLLDSVINYTGPVHILQGVLDNDVPYQKALTIQQKMVSEDVTLHLIKDGNHSLSREQDLDVLWGCVKYLTRY